ncbi:unnamed protein product [Cyprideis torosa]|uniref:Kynurenine 3-monooxygenase n=1 Tax=Cyprideis torosa TaxID=163714 RepID=A0A7R8ZHA1_9CRUS|nr:unnamed protein product [Cyprideis torosa]CAG0882078.1 unnamed protein product [Cyprideis torosa]
MLQVPSPGTPLIFSFSLARTTAPPAQPLLRDRPQKSSCRCCSGGAAPLASAAVRRDADEGQSQGEDVLHSVSKMPPSGPLNSKDGLDYQPHSNGKLKVVIVGGGLVGSCNAIHFAKRGDDVTVYEARPDPRKQMEVRGRSINLALSDRGLAALRNVGLEDTILKKSVPMEGRMIHSKMGVRTPLLYGTKGQCIYSVSRRFLNEALLNAAEESSNTKVFFRHKLLHGDLEEGKLTLLNMDQNQEFRVETDLIIGCDGAYSAVRRQMMKRSRFNFSQTYIEHGYLELCMPPVYKKDGTAEFAMEPNYLHIWPRDNFMLIALPNQDRSWTVTLFMSFQMFQPLHNEKALLAFFSEHFQDALELIGAERLCKDFFRVPAQPLVSVKCNPYHTKCSIIMGDAAHAMVPFYGQGMNAGLEDCLIFHELMRQHSSNLQLVLKEFSRVRQPDAEAICELALYNYIEMRYLVNSKMFRIRKFMDRILYSFVPSFWVPLYTMVTFTRTPYRECIENKQWQDRVLHRTVVTTLITASISGILSLFGFGWVRAACDVLP